MAFKPIVINYTSRNNKTLMTDIKGQVYVDGVAKAVAASALTFSELDAVNAPGVYFLVVTAVLLASFGASNGATLEVFINSASQPASAQFKQTVTSISTEDLDAHLTLQDATLSAIQTTGADTNTKVGAIKVDLETGPNSLASLALAIAAVQSAVGSIQNTTNFSASIPEPITRPGSGSNVYRLPLRLMNDKGLMADADSNIITVSASNAAGIDRGSILTGYSGGTANAIRDSLGVYHIDMSIPASQAIEGLNFTFIYSVAGVVFNQGRAGAVVTDVQADGFALQATLLATQTTVNDADALLNNVTFGLSAANTLQSAIQSLLLNGTYGLSALQSILSNGTYGLSALQVILNNSTYGLAAANTLQNSILAGTTSNSSNLALIEGTGFATATDSLNALSSRIYSGGRAV